MEDIDKLIEEMEAKKPTGNCFWRHKWTVWSKPYAARVTKYGTWVNGQKQNRMCLKCGKVKERNV